MHNSSFTEFGGKAQSLIDIQNIPNVLIPPIHPLSHQSILNLLLAANFDLQKKWQQIITSKPDFIDVKDYILAQAKSGKIAELRDEIVDLSSSLVIREKLANSSYLAKNLPTFIAEAKSTAQQFTIMCRSSGDEDQTNNTNPGGNESYPVQGNLDDIASKIVLVLASYFSEKSFAQRAQSTESLAKMPQCSVLLQHMVGELVQDSTELALSKPECVSGVTFTKQADGETIGLMLINAAYGHGNGVVAGLVPTDTYIITEQGIDLSVANKTARIAPTVIAEKIELTKIYTGENTWSKQQALTTAQIKYLVAVCSLIEQHYTGKPLDIEWVYQDNKLHIVQVRELSKPQKEVVQSYIMNAEVSQLLTTGKNIVPSTNVRIVSNKQDIIATKSLRQALNYYQNTKPKNLQAIFVSEGVATSHEANYFRWLGIPVFAVENVEVIKENLAQQPLILCGQTSRLYKGDIAQFKVMIGLYMHPYKPTLTLKVQPKIQVKIQHAEQQTKSQANAEIVDINNFWGKVTKFIKKIRESNETEHILQLLQLVAKMHHLLSGIKVDRSLMIELDIVYQNTITACWSLNQTMQNYQLEAINSHEYKLQKLYALNRLESILLQENNLQITSALSLKQIFIESYQQKKLLQSIKSPENLQPEILELLTQALKTTSLCMNQEFKQELSEYIQLLAQHEPAWFIKLCIMFKAYHQDDILQIVINLMPELSIAKTSIVDSVKICAEQWEHYQKLYSSSIITDLKLSRAESYIWQAKIEEWSNPKEFTTLFTDFIDFIKSIKHFINLLKSARDLVVQQLLINSLTHAIDVYDRSLKELSSSQLYHSKSLQVENFSKLLKPYCQISSLVMGALPYEVAYNYTTNEKSLAAQIRDIAQMIDSIYHTAYESNFHEKYLQPSKDFNVSVTTFVNHINYSRGLNSLETFVDIFTLAHQNFLSTLGSFQQNCLNTSRLPLALSNLMEAFFIKLNQFHGPAQMINCSFNLSVIVVTYNQTLREHSATLTFTYDRREPKIVKFSMCLLMNNEVNRCSRTRLMARLFDRQNSNGAIRLTRYNEILGSSVKYFFENLFYWQFNVEKISTNELDNFATHIYDLFELTIDQEVVAEKNLQEESSKLAPYYQSGIFKDSLAGAHYTLKCMRHSIPYNHELILLAVKEILLSIIAKISENMQGEISAIKTTYPAGYKNIDIILELAMFLDLPERELREKVLKTFIEILTESENLQIILKGCNKYSNFNDESNFSLIKEMYLDIKEINTQEAQIFLDTIDNLIRTYDILSNETPDSIRNLAPFILTIQEQLKILEQKEKSLLEITMPGDFLKEAQTFRDFFQYCYDSSRATAHLMPLKISQNIYLNWLLHYPDKIKEFSAELNKSSGDETFLLEHYFHINNERIDSIYIEQYLAVCRNLFAINLETYGKESSIFAKYWLGIVNNLVAEVLLYTRDHDASKTLIKSMIIDFQAYEIVTHYIDLLGGFDQNFLIEMAIFIKEQYLIDDPVREKVMAKFHYNETYNINKRKTKFWLDKILNSSHYPQVIDDTTVKNIIIDAIDANNLSILNFIIHNHSRVINFIKPSESCQIMWHAMFLARIEAFAVLVTSKNVFSDKIIDYLYDFLKEFMKSDLWKDSEDVVSNVARFFLGIAKVKTLVMEDFFEKRVRKIYSIIKTERPEVFDKMVELSCLDGDKQTDFNEAKKLYITTFPSKLSIDKLSVLFRSEFNKNHQSISSELSSYIADNLIECGANLCLADQKLLTDAIIMFFEKNHNHELTVQEKAAIGSNLSLGLSSQFLNSSFISDMQKTKELTNDEQEDDLRWFCKCIILLLLPYEDLSVNNKQEIDRFINIILHFNNYSDDVISPQNIFTFTSDCTSFQRRFIHVKNSDFTGTNKIDYSYERSVDISHPHFNILNEMYCLISMNGPIYGLFTLTQETSSHAYALHKDAEGNVSFYDPADGLFSLDLNYNSLNDFYQNYILSACDKVGLIPNTFNLVIGKPVPKRKYKPI
jgi:hypothetical protein